MPNETTELSSAQQRWNVAFTALQLLSVPITFCWWPYKRLPAPGWAVAVLAFFAALMSVHEKMRSWQKFVWIILMAVMLRTEMRAIGKDRDKAYWDGVTENHKHEVEDAIQQDRFAANVASFKDLMGSSQKIMGITQAAGHDAKEGIQNLMGTGSYLEVIPQPTSPDDLDEFNMIAINRGKHVIWDASVRTMPGLLSKNFYNQAATVDLKPVSPGGLALITAKIRPSRDGVMNFYSFAYSSRSTSGCETMQLRFNKALSRWEFSYWYGKMKPMKKPHAVPWTKLYPWRPVVAPVWVGSQ